MNLFARISAALVEGERLALATVVETAGSTPRHPGARMAVAVDGGIRGTIGGGRIEVEVVEAAREVAAGGAPRRVRHHLVRDLAMCCGGRMELAIADAGASADVIAQAAAAVAARSPAILETPCDGGPLTLTPASRAEAARWRHPQIVATPAGERLREAIGLGERVVVFGGGHVGRAIGELASRCDFEIVLCDDGDTGAMEQATPWAAARVESFDLADAARALGGLGAGDLVLIVTRDHAVDQRILEQLIAGVPGCAVDELDFVGMIGSRGKVGRFRKRLEARGLLDGAGAARWARLHAPVGLDLGAETPEEIAVAVIAQLIAVRRRGAAAAGGWQRDSSGIA